VSSIALAHYILQLFEDGLLDSLPDWLSNRVEQAELRVPDLSGRIGQPVTGADQLLMNGDAAKKDLIVEDDASERN
jgi:hypothetical protein